MCTYLVSCPLGYSVNDIFRYAPYFITTPHFIDRGVHGLAIRTYLSGRVIRIFVSSFGSIIEEGFPRTYEIFEEKAVYPVKNKFEISNRGLRRVRMSN